MPLPTKWHKKNKRPPPGFDVVEPTLEALENELRDKVKESNLNKRKAESLWPVHQINWQKTRYIYDMYYSHKRIDRSVYQYCLDQKLVDAALIAKWKKPGYERLCSTYVINPANYKFGTVSICRVPWSARTTAQQQARDPTTGCMGCASGGKSQPRNIFGTKYGQNLAAVQMAREQRAEAKRMAQEQAAAQARLRDLAAGEDDDASTDDDDDDDYGPAPVAGVWAGSTKLEKASEKIADPDGDAETDTDEDEDDDERPAKKVKVDEAEE